MPPLRPRQTSAFWFRRRTRRRARNKPRATRPSVKSAPSAVDSRLLTPERIGAWQSNDEFGKTSRLGLHIDCPAMLLDDDVMAHGQTQARSLTGWLGGEKRIEHLLLYCGRDTRSIVPDPNFHAVDEPPCRSQKRRLEAIARLACAFCRRVEAVRDHIEKRPRDLLGIQLDLSGVRIEIAFEHDLEIRALGARAMIGKVEALLDEGIDLNAAALPASLA